MKSKLNSLSEGIHTILMKNLFQVSKKVVFSLYMAQSNQYVNGTNLIFILSLSKIMMKKDAKEIIWY